MSNLAKTNILVHNLYFRLMTLEREMSMNPRFEGLRVEEIHAITLIVNHGKPMRFSDLVKTLALSKGPVSLLIKRLVQKEYLWKDKSRDDGRGVVFGATVRGHAIARIHNQVHLAALQILLGGLNETELNSFSALLEKLAIEDLIRNIPIPIA